MKTAVQVRDELQAILRGDLVGPDPGEPNETETLPLPPSRWYLTGFLVPRAAGTAQRIDETAAEQVDQATAGEGDDEREPETGPARKAILPSSIGLSFLVPVGAKTVRATALWGDYAAVSEGPAEEGKDPSSRIVWKRKSRSGEVEIDVTHKAARPVSKDVPGSGGLKLVVSVRPVGEGLGVPKGARAVSLFLVNERDPQPDEKKDEGFAFQAGLRLECEAGFLARPDLRGHGEKDSDDQIADLQFRDCFEFGVGHAVSATALVDDKGACRKLETAWIPSADVEKVEPAAIEGTELSMEALAATVLAEDFRKKLTPLARQYRDWIEGQAKKAPTEGPRKEVAAGLLSTAEFAAKRIEAGVALLDVDDAREAFRLANRTMAIAARRRWAQANGKGPGDAPPPTWRPFQLAFLLLNLRSIAVPEDKEREIVDLLFFPTGGGKTEAYLGLAAFTLVLRRMRNKGLHSAGVTVLMRYTLRLLTLDQLSRAATLICALELERQRDVKKLGEWPFEIGLWVGQKATPNHMGRSGDNDRHSARARTIAYKNDSKGKPSPIPLENCPWCGVQFRANSFNLLPDQDRPTNLVIHCLNRECDFSRGQQLPILAVDEPIYRRLPCFLIATVDKFANLPWVGSSGALLGGVDRYDASGFYGNSEPKTGKPLGKPLLPPELVIQDELHLISGPLGTMVGLYETAIDALANRPGPGDRTIRPKVVASTATVRRAEKQIQALFCRAGVEIFPPPGPDRRDSFFARTVATTAKPGRRYLGIAAQGRSLKVVLLRTYIALLSAAQRLWVEAGGPKSPDNSVDPYMTVLGYFSSLRELGGSRRIVEDEVTARAGTYARRLRVGEATGPFADRRIAYEALELTSREPTNKIADTKRRLALRHEDKEHVDVALATNMISVGLDITRLGLMVVLGQPKSTAEYIQATSRVGRDDKKPGLVVTILNVHRPRDRSHFERFAAYHASFYRAVEATSVTPFSPRAVDRGIAAVTVALARHGHPPLAPPTGARELPDHRTKLAFVQNAIRARCEQQPNDGSDADDLKARHDRIESRVGELLDAWSKIATEKNATGAGLQYQREEGGAPPLLRYPLDPELENVGPLEKRFKANRSLRDVEPTVNLRVRRRDEGGDS